MRIIEIILLLTLTVLPFIKRPILQHIRPNYILIFLSILVSMHLLIEGWRWQMFPAYLLVILIGASFKTSNFDHKTKLSFLKIIGFLGLFILTLVAWILPIVLPVFALPELRGSYSVGTDLIQVQTDLDEIITSTPNDKRELIYKIWYPSEADVSSMKSEPYVDQASRAGFATKYGLRPRMLNYLDRVKSNVYTDIPIANKQFPVLIFSHGYGSKATGYYALLSEIASQGYVIINMNHTYESLGVTFPDGRRKYFDYDFQKKISSNSMEDVQPIIDAFKNELDYEERHSIVKDAVKGYFMGEMQNRWAKDILITLDLLEQWNDSDLLENKLDLEKIGVIGHSVGGGSIGNAAMKDNRIKAAVNLDGIQYGNMIDSTYRIPYLYVSADWPAEHEDLNAHIFINKSEDYFYETKLLQSGHPNFMDIPFMIPIRSLTGCGNIDPYQGMEMVTKLVTSFFDKHLKQLPDADPQKIGDQYDLLEMTIYQNGVIK